ncbi:MAG: (Fe-S)-binding protein [bacterium]|nr:(Fe-S)-binding protein [bacterium]
MKTIKDIDEIAAACSDCGNCLHACPVYNVEWIEPNSPRGKVNLIKALRDGRLKPNALNRRFIYQCMVCGSCQHICTKGVDFTAMMMEYRNMASGGRRVPFFKKVVLYFFQSVLFKKLTGVVDILARTPLKKKLTIPRRRPAKLRKLLSGGSRQTEYDILLFPGCVLTHFYPEIIEKTYRFLESKGFSVVIPRHLECCGFPYKSQGWDRKFVSFRKKNEKLFSQYRFKYLLAPCGTCVGTLKEFYQLQSGGIEFYELSEFFHKFIKDAVVKGAQKGKTTWHDPCHHLKTLGIEGAPRHFMKQLGEDFIDDKSALCCGFGGIFSVGFPATSRKILKRKEERLNELGADTVVTACPGCYLHLRENLDREVEFFIDLFD